MAEFFAVLQELVVSGYDFEVAALQYDQDRHEAPVVVAKGSSAVAEKIIAMAKKHDIRQLWAYQIIIKAIILT